MAHTTKFRNLPLLFLCFEKAFVLYRVESYIGDRMALQAQKPKAYWDKGKGRQGDIGPGPVRTQDEKKGKGLVAVKSLGTQETQIPNKA